MARKWLKKFVETWADILHLIYPNICLICKNELAKNDHEICFLCKEEMHFTHCEKYTEASQLDKLFWGNVKIEHSYALLNFQKGNSTQKILHEIKYKGKQQLGIRMGAEIGQRFLEKEINEPIDILIPLPLHPKKMYTRGYNQSECIAAGLSEKLKIPVDKTILKRIKHGESQTKKDKIKRWEAVKEAYFVKSELVETIKHIAIVDDVITTGSTLESCIKSIQQTHPNIKVSVICLAHAN